MEDGRRLSAGTIDAEDRNVDRAKDGLRPVGPDDSDAGHVLRLVRDNRRLMLSVTRRNGAAVADKHGAVCDLFTREIERLVTRSDADGSGTIEGRELDHLCLRLETQLAAHGIEEWDGEAFREMVGEDNGVDHILEYCRGRFHA